MTSLDRTFIDDLLSRIDIIEVISAVVQLKKHGTGYKGLCPFHAENTPSLNVSSTKQFYHCFGCGASGDAIKFLREHDGLTFMEAIEKLAAQANIEIPKTYSKPNNNLKEFSNINSIIKKRFIKNLKSHGTALDYLKKRGITDDLINKFETPDLQRLLDESHIQEMVNDQIIEYTKYASFSLLQSYTIAYNKNDKIIL